MTEVHILTGYHDYESTSILAVFASAESAAAARARCDEWKRAEPLMPASSAADSIEDPEWTAYIPAYEAWSKATPYGSYDGYSVSAHEVQP